MVQTDFQPINIFVSYSHFDDKYRKKLQKALGALRQRKLINEWYDAKITPGDEMDPDILRQLSSADIIILLLSQSFIDSDYCWNTERPVALQLRQQRNVRVVVIVVEKVNLKGLELSSHKLLPKDMKPIQHWHPQSDGWNDVCVGIEQVIEAIRNPSQVDDALGVPKEIVATASTLQSSMNAKRTGKVQEFDSVGEFWEHRGSTVVPGCIVSLEGTFTQFAPMLMGAPKAKARLHKAFRQALERNQALRKRKGQSLDACLSVSAGQMVWRLRDDQSAHIYFGLYNSIVRNSIPVLVARDYYSSHLEPLFREFGRKTFEAQITGRVIELDNSPAKQFMNKHARAFIPDEVVNELCKDVYGLVVDGVDTLVERRGNARYLDGDIWIAVESDGSERFLTSFLDVTNPVERKEELDLLFRLAQSLPGSPRIMAQYDEDHEFAPDLEPVSNKNRFLDSIWRFGFGS